MGFEVKIIKDSVHLGCRLTTFQLKYPRFIHSEFMTHRVFSRNASSSRAIPVAKMIEQVRNDPAMPIHWGKNQPGMQATEELSEEYRKEAIRVWKESAQSAANFAEDLMDIGIHKQVANRILEPFQWISVVCTTTDLDNFFELRSHADAQPEIKLLSDMMKEALDNSTPEETKWHIPYVSKEEWENYSIDSLVKFSVARCARVSYLTHDGKVPSPEKDIDLYERLVVSEPLHASPAEHQAKINSALMYNNMSGNFKKPWLQFRKFLENSSEQMFFQDK